MSAEPKDPIRVDIAYAMTGRCANMREGNAQVALFHESFGRFLDAEFPGLTVEASEARCEAAEDEDDDRAD